MHAIDAPLGLVNILTLLSALACLWVVSPEGRGRMIRAWVVPVPGALAGLVAIVLLAGVFEAKPIHDAEWIMGLLLGAFIGRARGWSLHVDISATSGVMRVGRRWDGVTFAVGVVAMAVIDLVNAAAEEPILHPAHVAAAAAFCAGFLGCRALALLVRLTRTASGQVNAPR